MRRPTVVGRGVGGIGIENFVAGRQAGVIVQTEQILIRFRDTFQRFAGIVEIDVIDLALHVVETGFTRDIVEAALKLTGRHTHFAHDRHDRAYRIRQLFGADHYQGDDHHQHQLWPTDIKHDRGVRSGPNLRQAFEYATN